ncbi:MAG: hypothetical protein KDH18_05275, partial [Rhodoferax sp.]|nr:hypothetical protein [Rhodoferax sp.]
MKTPEKTGRTPQRVAARRRVQRRMVSGDDRRAAWRQRRRSARRIGHGRQRRKQGRCRRRQRHGQREPLRRRAGQHTQRAILQAIRDPRRTTIVDTDQFEATR